MQSKPKSNSVVTHTLREDGTIVFHVKGCEDIVFDPQRASESVRRRAMLHGFIQRITDGGAKSRDDKTGKPAEPADRRAGMAKIAEHYLTGTDDWNLTREGGGPGLDGTALAAVAEATGKTLDEVRAMVAAGAERRGVKPTEYLAAVVTADAVAPILARMRAAKVEVSGDDLLAEMTQDDE